MSDAAPPAASPTASRRASLSRTPALAALIYLVYYQIVLHLPADFPTVVVSTLLSLVLIIWYTASLGRALTSRRATLIAVGISAATCVPLRMLYALGVPAAAYLNAILPGLSDLLMASLAASVGVALSYGLSGVNLIPPVAAVLALVDIWTVLLGGPVQKVMNSNAPAAKMATKAMTVAMATPHAGAAPITVSVGFADFLFIAFFVAAICRFVPTERTYRRTLYGISGILTLYMVLLISPIGEAVVGLPALVPMGIAMISLHWRHFHYQRSEVFALIYASLFIALIAAGFWYMARRTQAAADQAPPAAQHALAPRPSYRALPA